jgi:hypothetical protein
MKIHKYFVTIILCILASNFSFGQHGVCYQYETLKLDFTIESTTEIASENPFTDFKLQVEFINGDYKFSVPGFYSADGNAAETSAESGGVWRVLFVPNHPGNWSYTVSFKKGRDIATSQDNYYGAPVKPHHEKVGTLKVLPFKSDGKFFEKRGRLQYHKSGYFHTENGKPLLKMGTNSPENFLAYADIDSTYSYDPEKNYLKTWQPHVKDWKEGDPSWQNGKGKGILGALNYLASEKMNALYALTLNIEGDAKDVWPFLSHNRSDFQRYDVSKLAQWDIILSHAEDLGIMVQLVTQEKENELILDDGDTRSVRKLYYRELIARFAHHKNIIWNMGEENGSAPWWPNGQSDQQRYAMMRYVKDTDPYKNPVVIHTLPEEDMREPVLSKLLGFDKLDGVSMQIGTITNIHHDIKKWIGLSKKSEKPWIVSMDEIGPWHTGSPNDADNTRIDSLRTNVLWSTLTAGGAGVEWYFGWLKPPNDLNAEDLRSRSKMWKQSAIAIDLFDTLPYTEMVSLDDKLTKGSGFCFGKEGEKYLVYLKNGENAVLDLKDNKDNFDVKWYNPRAGGELLKGSISQLTGGSEIDIGKPPSEEKLDWAVVISKI